MPKDHNQIVEENLATVIELLQNLLALELSKKNVPQDIICKRLHVTKAKVGKMLEGVRREK